jgi:hypothetical protein
MKVINKLRDALDGLESKDFYKYLIIIVAIISSVLGGMMYWHYSTMSDLRTRLNDINDIREKQVRSMIKRMNIVKQQRGRVKNILAKEQDFKIAGYFNDILAQQGLLDQLTESSTSEVEMSNDNIEISLRARFSAITMKQLCELLDAIEKKERIYAKNLEILKSVKTPETIDVNMTIATLQPKMKRGR